MKYDWVAQNFKQNGTVDGGEIEGVNPSFSGANGDPYEDWEKATRPKAYKKKGQGDKYLDVWQPVYVELTPVNGSLAKAAGELLRIAGVNAKEIALTEDARLALVALAKGGAGVDQNNEHLIRFFYFRQETEASSSQVGAADLPINVIKVGPAIPFAFVPQPLTDENPPALPRVQVTTRPVVTAVIDDQIGFLNERFRKTPGKTRIERLWLQGMPTFLNVATVPLAWIGQEFGSTEINTFLSETTAGVSENSIYQSAFPDGVASIPPPARVLPAGAGIGVRNAADLADPSFIRPFAFQDGHGTHVLDLAAGHPVESAPDNRPIFAVQLPKLAVAETWGTRLDLFVLSGVMRILRWADTQFVKSEADATPVPASVVINISYGVLAGPKDGTAFLEREIARLVRLRNARTGKGVKTVVVVPSGNGYRAQTRARMELSENELGTVMLRVQPEDLSVSFVEMWMERDDKLGLTITPPIGRSKKFDLSATPQIIDWQADDITIGRVYIQDEVHSGRRRVIFAWCPTVNFDTPTKAAPCGAYEISIVNRGTKDTTVDIDVQRDDTPSTFPSYGRQAYLDGPEVDRNDPEIFDRIMPDTTTGPVTRSGTMSALATSRADDLIAVGGAFDRHAFEKAALYTGSGLGLPCGGPALAAVSEETRAHPGRLAAGLFSGSASVFSGTSMAAPQVTRLIVDQMAALIAAGQEPAYDLKALLDPTHTFPGRDDRLGAGVTQYAEQPGRQARRVRA